MKKGYLASFPCVTYECMFLNMLHSFWTRERTGMFADLKTSHNCANSVSTLNFYLVWRKELWVQSLELRITLWTSIPGTESSLSSHLVSKEWGQERKGRHSPREMAWEQRKVIHNEVLKLKLICNKVTVLFLPREAYMVNALIPEEGCLWGGCSGMCVST